MKSWHLQIDVSQHIQICIPYSSLETSSLFVYDVILGCTIYVPLFITFYASVNHILVMGPFLRIGDIIPHKHKNRITNLIMWTAAWKWQENILGETNCILLAKYLQANQPMWSLPRTCITLEAIIIIIVWIMGFLCTYKNQGYSSDCLRLSKVVYKFLDIFFNWQMASDMAVNCTCDYSGCLSIVSPFTFLVFKFIINSFPFSSEISYVYTHILIRNSY